MRLTIVMFALVGLFVLPGFIPLNARLESPVQTQLTVTAVNKLKIARPGETIELAAKDLASLAEKDINKLHVLDSAGKEVLSQSVDTDYDDYHKPDMLIFQADFAPGETKTFTVTAGSKRVYKRRTSALMAASCANGLMILRGRMIALRTGRTVKRSSRGKASRSPAAPLTSGQNARRSS